MKLLAGAGAMTLSSNSSLTKKKKEKRNTTKPRHQLIQSFFKSFCIPGMKLPIGSPHGGKCFKSLDFSQKSIWFLLSLTKGYHLLPFPLICRKFKINVLANYRKCTEFYRINFSVFSEPSDFYLCCSSQTGCFSVYMPSVRDYPIFRQVPIIPQ